MEDLGARGVVCTRVRTSVKEGSGYGRGWRAAKTHYGRSYESFSRSPASSPEPLFLARLQSAMRGTSSNLSQ